MLSLHFPVRTRRHEQGFTLVEIMVAMVIGMLGVIIIMQMLSTFEGQKRTTTGGDDANNAGAIALFGMVQDLQQAGYCFSTSASAAAITLPLGAAIGSIRPVMVNASPTLANNLTISDANTNTLLVAYGNDSCAPESASGVASAATLNVSAYAVKNGNLMQCDYLASNCATAANWVQIADGIVGMKAECNGQQGVRVALIARNSQLEKYAVTPASSPAPTWSGTGAIDLTGTAADAGFTWQNYRYKTFETMVPIRNTILSGAQGC